VSDEADQTLVGLPAGPMIL